MSVEIPIEAARIQPGGDVYKSLTDTASKPPATVFSPFAYGVYTWVATGMSQKDGRTLRIWARKMIMTKPGDPLPPVIDYVYYEGRIWCLTDEIILYPSNLKAYVAPKEDAKAAPPPAFKKPKAAKQMPDPLFSSIVMSMLGKG